MSSSNCLELSNREKDAFICEHLLGWTQIRKGESHGGWLGLKPGRNELTPSAVPRFHEVEEDAATLLFKIIPESCFLVNLDYDVNKGYKFVVTTNTEVGIGAEHRLWYKAVATVAFRMAEYFKKLNEAGGPIGG